MSSKKLRSKKRTRCHYWCDHDCRKGKYAKAYTISHLRKSTKVHVQEFYSKRRKKGDVQISRRIPQPVFDIIRSFWDLKTIYQSRAVCKAWKDISNVEVVLEIDVSSRLPPLNAPLGKVIAIDCVDTSPLDTAPDKVDEQALQQYKNVQRVLEQCQNSIRFLDLRALNLLDEEIPEIAIPPLPQLTVLFSPNGFFWQRCSDFPSLGFLFIDNDDLWVENQDPTEVVLDFAKFRSLQHVLISNSRVRLKNSELAELKVLEVPKQEFDASFFQASRIIILISPVDLSNFVFADQFFASVNSPSHRTQEIIFAPSLFETFCMFLRVTKDVIQMRRPCYSRQRLKQILCKVKDSEPIGNLFAFLDRLPPHFTKIDILFDFRNNSHEALTILLMFRYNDRKFTFRDNALYFREKTTTSAKFSILKPLCPASDDELMASETDSKRREEQL